jgi:DNA-binding phage protein
MRDRDHDVAMAEMFAADRAYAAELLNSVLADGDETEIDVTLRQLALAFGIEGNGTSTKTLLAIASSMGLRLAVTSNGSRG